VCEVSGNRPSLFIPAARNPPFGTFDQKSLAPRRGARVHWVIRLKPQGATSMKLYPTPVFAPSKKENPPGTGVLRCDYASCRSRRGVRPKRRDNVAVKCCCEEKPQAQAISAIDAFDCCNIIRARSMRFSITKL